MDSCEPLLRKLEEIFSEVRSLEEQAPGVYYVVAREEEGRLREYYAAEDHSPFFAKIQGYGRVLPRARLFDVNDDRSGWRVLEYELCRYMLQNGTAALPGEALRDIGLHAAEHHPEYFGKYPVPVDTPWGYTLRHWELGNGICWLETDRCAEGLALCGPIWRAELSDTARRMGTRRLEYLFFSPQSSCVPIFELMKTRREWDGTLVDRQALMNAIWASRPQYALIQNSREQLGRSDPLAALLLELGAGMEPRGSKREWIGIFPDIGTDFLRLPIFPA